MRDCDAKQTRSLFAVFRFIVLKEAGLDYRAHVFLLNLHRASLGDVLTVNILQPDVFVQECSPFYRHCHKLKK